MKAPDQGFELVFPQGFEERAREYEDKGVVAGVEVRFAPVAVEVVFYDPVRLRQDVESELASDPIFFEKNIIVLKELTRDAMQNAVDELVRTGRLATP